jgi:hypothetical protein
VLGTSLSLGVDPCPIGGLCFGIPDFPSGNVMGEFDGAAG